MNPVEFCTLVENAIESLRKQGKPSKGANGACFYLNRNTGDRCIVGWMMPDEVALEAQDCVGDTSISTLNSLPERIVPETFKWLSQFDAAQVDTFLRLQNLHDFTPLTSFENGEVCDDMISVLEDYEVQNAR